MSRKRLIENIGLFCTVTLMWAWLFEAIGEMS